MNIWISICILNYLNGSFECTKSFDIVHPQILYWHLSIEVLVLVADIWRKETPPYFSYLFSLSHSSNCFLIRYQYDFALNKESQS